MGLGPYAASKHGIIGLTQVAAGEAAAGGVRVNAILAGAIRSPMTDRSLAQHAGLEEAQTSRLPLRRRGEPEEVAELAVALFKPGFLYNRSIVRC